MTNYEQQKYLWCEFEARENSSILIEYAVLVLQIIIFSSMIYAFIKARRHNQLDQVSNVYKYIIMWLIIFFLKTLINVLAYWIYMIQSVAQNEKIQFINSSDSNIGLKILSSIFFFLDSTTTFFLQNTMIYIPYTWMNNALQHLYSFSLEIQQRKSIGRIYSLLQIIKKYMYFRFIYLFFFIIAAVINYIEESPQQYGKYLSIVSIVESVVILFIYLTQYFAYKVVKNKLTFKKEEQKMMYIEYSILLICNFLRIILNGVFYFSDLIHYMPDKNCYDAHNSNQTTINCLFLIIGLLFTHIIPGVMILYVYWPSNKQKNQMRGSLLISSFQRF